MAGGFQRREGKRESEAYSPIEKSITPLAATTLALHLCFYGAGRTFFCLCMARDGKGVYVRDDSYGGDGSGMDEKHSHVHVDWVCRFCTSVHRRVSPKDILSSIGRYIGHLAAWLVWYRMVVHATESRRQSISNTSLDGTCGRCVFLACIPV